MAINSSNKRMGGIGIVNVLKIKHFSNKGSPLLSLLPYRGKPTH